MEALAKPDQNQNTLERSFEEQFADRKRFETYGGHITVTDIIPKNYWEQEDRTPVVFVNGFLANIDGFELTMQGFAEGGSRVIGMNHSNRVGRQDEGLPHHDLIVQKAEDLLTLVKELRLKECDLVAHSEGFIVAILASKILANQGVSPMPFRKILGVAPAGVEKIDWEDISRVPEMVLRGAIEMIRHPNVLRIATSTFKYIGKNVLKIPREGWAIKGTEVTDIVNELSNLINIAVLLAPNDEVISSKKLHPVFESGKVQVSAVATVRNRNVGHAAILSDPHTISAAVEMLDSMRDFSSTESRRVRLKRAV